MVDERSLAQDLLAQMRRAEAGCVEGGELREQERPMEMDPEMEDETLDYPEPDHDSPADDDLNGATDEIGMMQRGRATLVPKLLRHRRPQPLP